MLGVKTIILAHITVSFFKNVVSTGDLGETKIVILIPGTRWPCGMQSRLLGQQNIFS